MRKTNMIIWFLFLAIMLGGRAYCQESITEILKIRKNEARWEMVEIFYSQANFQPVWITSKPRQEQLFSLLQSSDSYGLNEKSYQFSTAQAFRSGKLLLTDKKDSLLVDVLMTDAALHFLSELRGGNQSPYFRYDGLKFRPNNEDLPQLLIETLQQGTLLDLATRLEPQNASYKAMVRLLRHFLKVKAEPGFSEARIFVRKNITGYKELQTRLYHFGLIDSSSQPLSYKDFLTKLKAAQKLFDCLNDGIMRSTFVKAINLPISGRIEELKIGINNLRWTEQLKNTGLVAILNLPSAFIMVWDEGRLLLDSKAIVGKPSSPTPMLTSTITEVILYPYWTVPRSIATKELLPSIKSNPGFLSANGYQVLNQKGKIINPYRVNWAAVSASNFQYIIRQSTGCDNALGLVKFNFNNPFTVYWHDTPAKGLFALNKRYFSHGCMRMEKPVELARILLGINRIAIDTLTEKGCLQQQSPLVLKVEKSLPIVVMYSTLWYNVKGEISFFDDIYGKLPEEKRFSGTVYLK